MMSPSKTTKPHPLAVLIRSAMLKSGAQTASQFARLIGVPVDTLGPYLRGARKPKRGWQFWNIEAICMKILGTSGRIVRKDWPYKPGWTGRRAGRRTKTHQPPDRQSPLTPTAQDKPQAADRVNTAEEGSDAS